MEIEFFKFQNCGNDFIIIDDVRVEAKKEKIKELTKTLMKRKYSIGANNVLYLHFSSKADAFMRIYNLSDIEGENCGNGSLCVAKYLSDKLNKDKITLETIAGLITVEKPQVELQLSNAGEHFTLKLREIKDKKEELKEFFTGKEAFDGDIKISEEIIVKGSVVQIGEPHLVIITKDLEEIDVQKIGDAANENKELFPLGINVSLVELVNRNTIRLRVYERSCFEETEACGTGSCCSAFVCKKLGLVDSNEIKVLNKGGELNVQLKGNEVHLIGSPKFIYKGYLEVQNNE